MLNTVSECVANLVEPVIRELYVALLDASKLLGQDPVDLAFKLRVFEASSDLAAQLPGISVAVIPTATATTTTHHDLLATAERYASLRTSPILAPAGLTGRSPNKFQASASLAN